MEGYLWLSFEKLAKWTISGSLRDIGTQDTEWVENSDVKNGRISMHFIMSRGL